MQQIQIGQTQWGTPKTKILFSFPRWVYLYTLLSWSDQDYFGWRQRTRVFTSQCAEYWFFLQLQKTQQNSPTKLNMSEFPGHVMLSEKKSQRICRTMLMIFSKRKLSLQSCQNTICVFFFEISLSHVSIWFANSMKARNKLHFVSFFLMNC